jgi:ParB family chromosome partitioning protein
MSPARKTAAEAKAGRGARPRAGAKKTTRKRGPAGPRGPEAREAVIDPGDRSLSALAERVREAGGAVVGGYRDPFAGTPLLMAALPLRAVDVTPFQRDLSRTHAKRLADAITAAGLYLDPVIAVPVREGFWSPNGRHRLAAAKQLGLRTVTALVAEDPALAYRILALNTEKAHNLRDRSLEVIRMARSLAEEQPRSRESDHATAFESAPFLTLGAAYERRPRFAGSAYNSLLRRVDRFLDTGLPAALRQRDQWAVRLTDADDRVTEHVKALQERGMRSPYLRTVVVARCNPIRWIPQKRGAPPPMSMAEALTRFVANVRKFDPASVRPQDLALLAAAGAPESE